MTANRRNINELRYFACNNLIIPYNLDIRKNENGLKIVARLCRLPKQEPKNFSILCISFIQRNPAISSKVIKTI